MRLSIVKSDPGYHPMAQQCRILLDGVEIKNCFTADEEEGKVYCYGGHLKRTRSGLAVKKEIKTGKVKIIKPENFENIPYQGDHK